MGARAGAALEEEWLRTSVKGPGGHNVGAGQPFFEGLRTAHQVALCIVAPSARSASSCSSVSTPSTTMSGRRPAMRTIASTTAIVRASSSMLRQKDWSSFSMSKGSSCNWPGANSPCRNRPAPPRCRGDGSARSRADQIQVERLALRDFQLQAAGWKARILHSLEHAFDQPGMVELPRGHIHGDEGHASVDGMPSALQARTASQAGSNTYSPSGTISSDSSASPTKCSGEIGPRGGWLPTHQRLVAGDAAAGHVQDRLVANVELAGRQCLAQVRLEAELLAGRGLHLRARLGGLAARRRPRPRVARPPSRARRWRPRPATRLEAHLREALAARDYQPMLHVASGRIAGYEALVRWNHPERGPISPRVRRPRGRVD